MIRRPPSADLCNERPSSERHCRRQLPTLVSRGVNKKHGKTLSLAAAHFRARARAKHQTRCLPPTAAIPNRAKRSAQPCHVRRGRGRPQQSQAPRTPVTSRVSRGGSGGVEFVDQVFGVSHEALDDTPAALFGSADKRSDRSEIVCSLERAEAARDFLLELHHPAVAFSLVVGERYIRAGQEAQNRLFLVSQPNHEVVPDATLGAAGTRGTVLPQFLWQSREPLVKDCSGRNDCIVAPTDEVDQALIGGLLFVP